MESSHPNRCMIGGVITVRPQIQPLDPCSLLSCNVVPQVTLHPLVYYLGLAISLWMITRARSQFCTSQSENLLPKGTEKPIVSVTHNSLGNPWSRKTSQKNNSATCEVDQSATIVKKCAYLVNLSSTVRM